MASFQGRQHQQEGKLVELAASQTGSQKVNLLARTVHVGVIEQALKKSYNKPRCGIGVHFLLETGPFISSKLARETPSCSYEICLASWGCREKRGATSHSLYSLKAGQGKDTSGRLLLGGHQLSPFSLWV